MFEDAVSLSLRLLNLDPHLPDVWRTMGVALCILERPAEARRALLAALKEKPNDHLAMMNYIVCCFHLNDAPSALEGIRRADR